MEILGEKHPDGNSCFFFGQKSFHYLALLKTTIRHSMTSLKASDAKDVASSVSVIANEKLKAEKDAAGKKKTGMECIHVISISIYIDMKNMNYARIVGILWPAVYDDLVEVGR